VKANVWYLDWERASAEDAAHFIPQILGMENPKPPFPHHTKVAENVEGDSFEDIYRKMNVVDGDELPATLGIRSLSVGDLLEVDGIFHLCKSQGWEAVGFNVEETPSGTESTN